MHACITQTLIQIHLFNLRKNDYDKAVDI